jgi:hypothetical protein
MRTAVIGGYGNFGALRSMLRLTVIADACFNRTPSRVPGGERRCARESPGLAARKHAACG